MSNRPSYLFPLGIGVMLAGMSVWLIESEARHLRTPAATLGPKPVDANSPATSQPAAPLPSAADVGVSAEAAQVIAEVQRRLNQPDARAHEGVLTFGDEASYRHFLARARQAGIRIIGQLDGLRTVRVRYDSADALTRDVLTNPADYADISANTFFHIPTAPSPEQRAAINQVPFGNTVLGFLGVAGDHSQWGHGTTIAVLDSGVMPDPTLQGRVRTLDLGLGTTAGKGAEDGHGTAVAALAAGAAADAPGVAPGASILSLRVTDANGLSDIFTVSQGILAAVDAGAKIINVSMGGYGTNDTLTRAIDYATEHGAVIVAAAGNDQAAQLTWPAADPRVISVGAVDAVGQQVLFSNSGTQLQMTAPGYGVQTAWLDNQRVLFDGTSASAPIVAGAIAAVMSESPGMNATQAWQVLQKYASDGGAPGNDPAYGNGILNLGWAMNRNDLTRVDTAIASHYYDAAAGTMEFVVQNRSDQAVAGLQLNVDTNGTTNSYTLPTLVPGGSSVVKVAVDRTVLAAAGTLTYRTQLNNPPGLVDQVPANNRKTSSLTTPTPSN